MKHSGLVELILFGVISTLVLEVSGASFKLELATYRTDIELIDALDRLIPEEPVQDQCLRLEKALERFHRPSSGSQKSISAVTLARLVSISASDLRKHQSEFQPLQVQQFIDSLENYLRPGGKMSHGFILMVTCLRELFENSSLAVNEVLNRPAVEENLDQLNSIFELSMEFIKDPTFKHPTIKLEELTPQVKRMLVDWLGSNGVVDRFVSDREDTRLRENLSSVVALISSYGPKMSKWSLSDQCRAISSFALVGLGHRDRNSALATVRTIEMNYRRSGRNKDWEPSPLESEAMVALIKELHIDNSQQDLLVKTLDCLTEIMAETDAAKQFVDEMEVEYGENQPPEDDDQDDEGAEEEGVEDDDDEEGEESEDEGEEEEEGQVEDEEEEEGGRVEDEEEEEEGRVEDEDEEEEEEEEEEEGQAEGEVEQGKIEGEREVVDKQPPKEPSNHPQKFDSTSDSKYFHGEPSSSLEKNDDDVNDKHQGVVDNRGEGPLKLRTDWLDDIKPVHDPYEDYPSPDSKDPEEKILSKNEKRERQLIQEMKYPKDIVSTD